MPIIEKTLQWALAVCVTVIGWMASVLGVAFAVSRLSGVNYLQHLPAAPKLQIGIAGSAVILISMMFLPFACGVFAGIVTAP